MTQQDYRLAPGGNGDGAFGEEFQARPDDGADSRSLAF